MDDARDGGDNGTRYAYKDDGSAATLEEFYTLYETYAITEETVIKEPNHVTTTPDLADGPPCLQVLCSQGFPEGTRNNGLFNIGVFLRKAKPDTWENELMVYNQKYMSPPLPLNEITLVSKQLKKKEYGYKCKDSPINGHCNASLCKTRKFGIGQSSDMPSISALSKYASDPPLWFVDVDGHRLELTTEELQQQAKFQVVCMNKVNVMPPTLKKQEWARRPKQCVGPIKMNDRFAMRNRRSGASREAGAIQTRLHVVAVSRAVPLRGRPSVPANCEFAHSQMLHGQNLDNSSSRGRPERGTLLECLANTME